MMDFNFTTADGYGIALHGGSSDFSEFSDLMRDAVPMPAPSFDTMINYAGSTSNLTRPDLNLPLAFDYPFAPSPPALGNGLGNLNYTPFDASGPRPSNSTCASERVFFQAAGQSQVPATTRPGQISTPPCSLIRVSHADTHSATSTPHPALDPSQPRAPRFTSLGPELQSVGHLAAGDTLARAKFTMEEVRESDVETDEQDEQRVAKLRERCARTDDEKAKRKILDLVRKEKKEKVEEGLETVMAKIAELKQGFAHDLGLSERVANNLVDGPQILKAKRALSFRDALISKKFAEVNASKFDFIFKLVQVSDADEPCHLARAPGNKAKLPEIQQLVTSDMTFNALTEEERSKVKEAFQREKEAEAGAPRPTPLSASKTADVRLKRVVEEVCAQSQP